MQRFLLLFLSVSLGVLVFLCSQRDFNLPILTRHAPEIHLKSFQPFYYAALHIEMSEDSPEKGIAEFLAEVKRQNLEIFDPLLIFKSDQDNAQQRSWIIATKIPESLQLTRPLQKTKWNWQNVLVWEGNEKEALQLGSEKLIRFMKAERLFAIGPIIEIYENSTKLKRKFWLPVQKEVGN